MTALVFLAESFAKALSSLLPGGRVWSREPGDVPSRLALALGQVYERHSARCLNLLTDAFPASTTELLDEWQQSVGLPDPCAGDNPSLAQQRSQIVARLTDNGGSSKQYFITFAAALGYTITIDEFAPSRFGRKFGGKFGGDDWACAWQVNMPTFTITNLKFGDLFGKSFASWGDAVLQCELERIKPAHTVIIFNYES